MTFDFFVLELRSDLKFFRRFVFLSQAGVVET